MANVYFIYKSFVYGLLATKLYGRDIPNNIVLHFVISYFGL